MSRQIAGPAPMNGRIDRDFCAIPTGAPVECSRRTLAWSPRPAHQSRQANEPGAGVSSTSTVIFANAAGAAQKLTRDTAHTCVALRSSAAPNSGERQPSGFQRRDECGFRSSRSREGSIGSAFAGIPQRRIRSLLTCTGIAALTCQRHSALEAAHENDTA